MAAELLDSIPIISPSNLLKILSNSRNARVLVKRNSQCGGRLTPGGAGAMPFITQPSRILRFTDLMQRVRLPANSRLPEYLCVLLPVGRLASE